jgi:hypothetical protein
MPVPRDGEWVRLCLLVALALFSGLLAVHVGPGPWLSLVTPLFKWLSRAGPWWLTPAIPATKEAEIRRITVQSQSRQIVPETLS